MAAIWKFVVAAALVTVGMHYVAEGYEKMKEAVSAKNQDGPHDTKK
ncbi:hypothetical protein ABID08_002031 [Rhizobium binae]|uniref:Uncharacterized protein n=1 Tax=Rhizobium binae TaxID=1138190 RepID=A0ABV2MDX6_9HYPH|nr:hypothetical protein [Rhizobium binae]MBX4992863.1 hypothetical protein [Rhizobium binae]QSY84194.1 hypothetical protein J2J99_10595 [Rhizobium binae]